MRKEHIFENGIEYKQCSKCKSWKKVADYHKDNSKWDGLHGYCRECTAKVNHKTYSNDPKAKYEKVLEYRRRTGLICEYKPYNPKYYTSIKSREKKRARDIRRRAIKKSADLESKIDYRVIEDIKKKYGNRCAYCGVDCEKIYHIDHKLPLSRGGGNNIDNLALSCPHCNYSKNDKTDEEFIGHKV